MKDFLGLHIASLPANFFGMSQTLILALPTFNPAATALAAGCDVALFCPGDAAGNAGVLEACPAPTAAALRRLQSAAALAQSRAIALDAAQMAAERDMLLR